MDRRLALAVLWALLLLVPAASASASNDGFAAARPLPLGAEDATVDNTGFTVEQGEALTAPGGPRDRCDLSPGESTQADRTAWWFVNGTGRPITVTAAGESFDTTLGIFPDGITDPIMCQDAQGPESLTFPTVAGQVYRIQVGSCATNSPHGCNPAGAGRIHVRATSPAPANDARGAPAPLPFGQLVAGDNYAAGEEAGEIISCGLLPYGRTVWYRLAVPSTGTVHVAVNGQNPSLAVFTSAGRRVGCDATPGANAQVTLAKVTAGDLLVQVGGVGAHAGLVADSIQGPFSIGASFTPLTDHGTGLSRLKVKARLAVAVSRRYARVRSLAARNVPAGAKVQLLCSGRSCPFRHSRAQTVRRDRAVVSLMSARLRKARILPVTTFEIHVTLAGRMGSVVRYRFSRLGRAPQQTTLCLAPGSKRPSRCPT